MNTKPEVDINHLIEWYHGTFCVRCARIDMESEKYGRKCYDKMKVIGKGINAPKMTHKEFVRIVKTGPFCKPIKRTFKECHICKALGVPQWKKNHGSNSLSSKTEDP